MLKRPRPPKPIKLYRWLSPDGKRYTRWKELPEEGLAGCHPTKRQLAMVGDHYGVQITVKRPARSAR